MSTRFKHPAHMYSPPPEYTPSPYALQMLYDIEQTPNPPQTAWDVPPHIIEPRPTLNAMPPMAPPQINNPYDQTPPGNTPDGNPYDDMISGCEMMARQLGECHPSGLPQQYTDHDQSNGQFTSGGGQPGSNDDGRDPRTGEPKRQWGQWVGDAMNIAGGIGNDIVDAIANR